MKNLKPSMRENKRYLLVTGHVEDVEESILNFAGVLGMSKTGLEFVRREKNSCVIAVNRESVDHVRAGFAVWRREITTERVSGTLKRLEGRKRMHKKH